MVYLDLRGHGRSTRPDPGDWTFEACADDVLAFCDILGIDKPIVYGHSMGDFVATLYGARHPGHAAALVLQSTMARFDLARLVESFRRFGGYDVAELAERDYGGDPVSADEWARVFAVFGPRVPGKREPARRMRNPELGTHGMELLRRFDVVDLLARIDSPTLVCVGDLDPVTRWPPLARSSMRCPAASDASRGYEEPAIFPGRTFPTVIGRSSSTSSRLRACLERPRGRARSGDSRDKSCGAERRD